MITIEDDGPSTFGGAPSGGDAGGGFMQPDFDPFDPKAWAEQDPTLFAGVNAEPEAQDSTSLPPVEEIAISGALDASGSLQRVQSSPRPVRQLAQQTSPSPLSGLGVTTAATPGATPPTAAADSDSDDSGQLDARAALYTLGMPESQDVLATSAGPSALVGGAHPFAGVADPLPGPMPGVPTEHATMAPGAAEDEDTVPLGVVVYEFKAVEEGELTVQGGEEVYVLGYIEGGWAQVQLLATGEVGNVPEWAVQEVDAQVAASGAIGASASVSRAISDADSALLRATSTPRPAPQPGAAVAARLSMDGPRHRRMASSATAFSDAVTPARNSARGLEDNPFTGGGNGGVDDILGLFDGGEVAADTADLPGVETADPFGLDGLFVTDHGTSASAGIGALAADVAPGEGDSAVQFETSAPALDPGLVAASGPGAANSAPAVAATAAVDNPFLAAKATAASAESAVVPASSDNPFG